MSLQTVANFAAQNGLSSNMKKSVYEWDIHMDSHRYRIQRITQCQSSPLAHV